MIKYISRFNTHSKKIIPDSFLSVKDSVWANKNYGLFLHFPINQRCAEFCNPKWVRFEFLTENTGSSLVFSMLLVQENPTKYLCTETLLGYSYPPCAKIKGVLSEHTKSQARVIWLDYWCDFLLDTRIYKFLLAVCINSLQFNILHFFKFWNQVFYLYIPLLKAKLFYN